MASELRPHDPSGTRAPAAGTDGELEPVSLPLPHPDARADSPTSALVRVVVAPLTLVPSTKEMAPRTIPDQRGHAPPPRVPASSSGPPESPSSPGCLRAEVPDARRRQAPPHWEPTPLFIRLLHHPRPGFSRMQSHLSPSGAAASLCSPHLPTRPTRSPQELPRARRRCRGERAAAVPVEQMGGLKPGSTEPRPRSRGGLPVSALPSAGREDSAGAPCSLAGGWLAPAATQGAANLVSEGLQSPGQVWNCSPT